MISSRDISDVVCQKVICDGILTTKFDNSMMHLQSPKLEPSTA